MTTNHYPYISEAGKTQFYFQSEGPNGTFDMAIEFEKTESNRFNLSLSVWMDNEWKDDVFTNNDDFWKIVSTVANATLEFFQAHPAAYVQIFADEKRRLKTYHFIIRRNKEYIERLFKISGLVGGIKSVYEPERFYDGFEIQLKPSFIH